MPKTPVKEGQIWQAKDYADHNERMITIKTINGHVIWIELVDGQTTNTNHATLTQNYHLVRHLGK